MAGLKGSILGPKIGKNWGFMALKFVRGMYEHPYRRCTISEHTASCGKLAQKSAQGRPNKSVTEKN